MGTTGRQEKEGRLGLGKGGVTHPEYWRKRNRSPQSQEQTVNHEEKQNARSVHTFTPKPLCAHRISKYTQAHGLGECSLG